MFLNALSIGEIFSVGGLTALIGISVTFAMLCLLVFALVFMDKGMKIKFSNKLNNQSKTIKDNALTQNVSNDILTTDSNNNSQIVAAIMAAITVVMGDDNKPQNKSKASFVVKSIKRI